MENKIILPEEQLKEMGITPNLPEGNVNMMGINIDISKTIGNTIAEQYLAQLSPELMEVLMNFITSDLFATQSRYDYTEGITKEIQIVKESKKNSWGNIEKYSIGDLIKEKFNKRIEEELKKKVEEIIASADYQERIDKIANELVEYSINGYANDMKERILERLVGNTMNPYPSYEGRDLRSIIHDCINERIG